MKRRLDPRLGCLDLQQTAQRRAVSRRGFLKAGVLGSAGFSLADLLRHEAQAASGARKSDHSIIILWMRGGPSHIDMWDTKPEAPVDYRGEFGVIDTTVPGIQLGDLMPMCAKTQHQWSIIRSLHHANAGHSAGDQILFTGHPPGADPNVNVYPSFGSVVAKQQSHLNPQLPSYVMIPKMVPGTDSAYLGVSYRPFETIADPANEGEFNIPNFSLAEGLSLDRMGSRRNLQSDLDRLSAELDRSGHMQAMDRFGQQAWNMLTSTKARDAFNLDAEPQEVRERYGFMPRFDPGASDRCGAPAWSQRVLLARRLVEAGVRLVTVDLRWWDTHVKGFDSLRRGFLPRFDQCYSALMEDLEQRGLMEKVMVVAWGEFGRTPKVNANAGRDHYPNVFSAAVSGGRIQGGRVVGSSDAKGAFPKANPKRPQDVLATMYDHLGIDTHAQYLNSAGRPISVLPYGDVITELF